MKRVLYLVSVGADAIIIGVLWMMHSEIGDVCLVSGIVVGTIGVAWLYG